MKKWFEKGKTRIWSIHIHYSSFAHSLRVTCKFVKAKQEETSGKEIFGAKWGNASEREQANIRTRRKHTGEDRGHKHCERKWKACDRLDLEGDEEKPLFTGASKWIRPSQRTILHISTFVISKQALPVCSEHENRPKKKEGRMRSIRSDERSRGPALRK